MYVPSAALYVPLHPAGARANAIVADKQRIPSCPHLVVEPHACKLWWLDNQGLRADGRAGRGRSVACNWRTQAPQASGDRCSRPFDQGSDLGHSTL
jgi:hypothetical protein